MWYRLIEGAQTFLLDELPFDVDVMIRSIDLMATCRDKALLWQAGVRSNQNPGVEGGAVIVTGLNVLLNHFTTGAKGAAYPEAAWLLHSLLQYAYTAPKPAKQLEVTPNSSIEQKNFKRSTHPDRCTFSLHHAFVVNHFFRQWPVPCNSPCSQ